MAVEGPGAAPRRDPATEWDGSPLEGRTILLHTEQGLGDAIQFIRFAASVRDRGGRVLVECPKGLVPLLGSCPGIAGLVARGEEAPPFDVHAPLLGLPRLLGTTLANLPRAVPYLSADPAAVARWGEELALDRSWKVGIAWQGNPRFKADRHRSIPLARFAPLAAVPGVRLYGLQKGPGTEQIAPASATVPLVDLGARLDEAGATFADTSAVMRHLDLIVTSDTSIAHLAGALGVPVWVALGASADWRWLLGREDCPWYPTMRLFRQSRPGDWAEVLARIADEVRRMAPRRAP